MTPNIEHIWVAHTNGNGYTLLVSSSGSLEGLDGGHTAIWLGGLCLFKGEKIQMNGHEGVWHATMYCLLVSLLMEQWAIS